MKKHQLVENLILILSVHTVRFFTAYYLHRGGGTYTVFDIIFDVLLAVITTWFMLIAFTQNISPFSTGSLSMLGINAKRRVLVKCLVFIGTKLLFDAAILFSARALADWRYLIEDSLTIAYWLIGYALFVQREQAIWSDKGLLRRVTIILLLLFGFSVCYDVHLIHQIRPLQDKYTEASPYLIRACANLGFLNSIKVFLLDTVAILVLLISHRKHTTDKQQTAKDSGNILKLFIRCDLMIALFLLLAVAKIAVAPQSVLIVSGETHKSSIKNFEAGGPFDMTISVPTTVFGFETTQSYDNAYYYTESILFQKGDALASFDFVGGEPDFVLTDAGIRQGEYVLFTDGTSNVYLYDYYAICYYENGTPRIVRMDALDQCDNQPIVTNLCKHLIEEGNLFAFEYAHEYLAKYDAEFITPYIERYRQGQFTDEETRWAESACYRLEYITDIAQQAD